MGSERNVVDSAKRAQQNEGNDIQANTRWHFAVHSEAGGAEPAYRVITRRTEKDTTVAQYGRNAHKRLNQEHWTLHDFRHTFTTMLNDLGVDPHIVEHITAHQMPGQQKPITIHAIYRRSGTR